MKEPRDKRTYDQRCGLASALDVVGERWTLLIIRELLLRPRRYRDLLDALPGIGTNLLADRLGFLTELGLVRPLDPDRRTGGYALTEFGERLREPVLALSRFGLSVLEREPARAGNVVRPSWAALAVEAMVDQSRAPAEDESYEFDVDGEVFHVTVADRPRVRPGAAPGAVLRIVTDTATFFDIGARQLDPLEAVLSGRVAVEGEPSAVTRCLRLLGLGRDTALRGSARRAEPRSAVAVPVRD